MEAGGELADGRGLARAVDANHQDDERLLSFDGQRLGDRRHELRDLGGEHALHLAEIAVAAVRHDGGDLRGGIEAEIGADQRFLDLDDAFGRERPAHHHVGNRGAEIGRGALEAAAQPLPPARLFRTVVHAGPVIAVSPMDAKMTPEEMVARLLYRDGLMLIIDKPAGFAVHKGPKGGESLEDHFGALRFGLPRAPALAHRLDRDTSGCLVLGRHRKALAELGRLFKQGRVGKTYWAVVEGGPAETEGRIDLPLGRLDESRGWWMKPDPHGQPAATTWKVLGRALLSSVVGTTVPQREHSGASGEGSGSTSTEPNVVQFTWLALEPLTGRTHQLRVHCAAMGWPVVGDTIYGNAPRIGGPGLYLHARDVVVPLYKNRAPIAASAPVPLHMHATLQACGWQGEVFRLVD